jgi:hypothetical protein
VISSCDLSSCSRRTTPEAQQTDAFDRAMMHSRAVFQGHHALQPSSRHRMQYDTLISYAFMIILFILPFILGHMVAQWGEIYSCVTASRVLCLRCDLDQPMMKKMSGELDRVNERLDQLGEHYKRSLEEAITKQVTFFFADQ